MGSSRVRIGGEFGKGLEASKGHGYCGYLQGVPQTCAKEFMGKADKIFYYALVTAEKRDSYARKKIMASRHADAVPQVERNQGLKLFNMFQDIFLNKSKSQANLPNTLLNFNQMKMTTKESAKEYISRVDLAVSDLALLNEKVSVNSWLFILANGLRPEFAVTRKGVLFMGNGYGSIRKLRIRYCKKKRLMELANLKKRKILRTQKSEIAHAVVEGKCSHRKKKGHKKADCFSFKKSKEGADKKPTANKYWFDICYMEGHSTDYCSYNPKNKGKGKGKAKGKTKGNGNGKGGKGKSAKGGRGSGNFPANYISEEAYYAADQWNSNWESSDDQKEESSSNDWQDYNFSIFENENEQLLFTQTKKDDDLEK
jgi:hypothetical protein